MTERAEQDGIRAPGHDGRGNGGDATVGRDWKGFGQRLRGAGQYARSISSPQPA